MLEGSAVITNKIKDYIIYVLDKRRLKAPGSIILTEMKGGENHRLYKAVCRWSREIFTLKLVVRINVSGTEHEREKSRREAIALSHLGGFHAPELYDFDVSGRWFPDPLMCMEFISGKSVALNRLPHERIKILGSVFSRLHSMDVSLLDFDHDIRFKHPVDYLTSRWYCDFSRKIPTDDLFLPPATILRRFWRVHDLLISFLLRNLNINWFSDDLKLSLTHADAGSDNIIWKRRDYPCLIDWEYTRLGDPAEEIAYIFTENRLNGFQEEAFWEGYNRNSSLDISILQSRVRIWKSLTSSGLWWLDRYIRALKIKEGNYYDMAITKRPEYYLDKALDRLKITEQLTLQ